MCTVCYGVLLCGWMIVNGWSYACSYGWMRVHIMCRIMHYRYHVQEGDRDDEEVRRPTQGGGSILA